MFRTDTGVIRGVGQDETVLAQINTVLLYVAIDRVLGYHRFGSSGVQHNFHDNRTFTSPIRPRLRHEALNKLIPKAPEIWGEIYTSVN